MTAVRVLHPVVLTEFCKLRASPSAVGRNLPCGRQLNRIKRDLFGPANPVETTKIFTEEMDKHQEKAMKRWGFDFRTGLPAACSTNSQYIWERVSYQESSVVPEMYTLTRAAHVRPEQAELTSTDVLMDERAERENLANISASTDESCDDDDEECQAESLPAVFKVPAATVVAHSNNATTTTSTVLTNKPNLRKRQPKITEYMKERKRLAPTPKKASPIKRMRTSSGGSSTSSGFTHSAHGQSITSHFAAMRSHVQQRQQQR